MTTTLWLGDAEAKPAPGALRRVQAFVNTIDLESGQDRLADASDARPWLTDNDLLAPGATLTTDDLRLLSGVRESVRALIIQNSGGPNPDAEVMAPLRSISESSSVRAALDEKGVVTLSPDGETVPARLLSLLLIVKEAQVDGTWSHMKVCANDDCLWAFYDRSRNHGGTWCDMATCGNKLKNRDFRARRRAGR